MKENLTAPKFFILKPPGTRTFQYAWKDAAFLGFEKTTCTQCGRAVASMAYSGPHCLLTEGGAKFPDYLAFCGAGEGLFVISERAADVFRSNRISGMTGFAPIQVAKEADGVILPLPEGAPNYVLVQITGTIDLDLKKMCLKKKKVCSTCGGFEWNRQRLHPLYIDADTWDGSDVCRNESIPGYIIFSKGAVDAIKKHRLKGFGLDPL